MLTDNLNNGCQDWQAKNLDERVDRIEDVINGYDNNFSSKNISTQKITANEARVGTENVDNVKAGTINAETAHLGGAVIDGTVQAKNFNIQEPVILSALTTPKADVSNLDATNLTSTDAKITNLTVDNLMTSPDASLEYKNLSVTNVANINKLNIMNPNINEVNTLVSDINDLTTQHINMRDDAHITRNDTGATVLSFGDGYTQVGENKNDVVLAGINRPKWNDRLLATLADIQTGGIQPVYKGTVETYDLLPADGNTLGDLYIVKTLTIPPKTGIGHAMWNGQAWDPVLIYELELFETKEEAAAAVKALEDKIADVINGVTPVTKVANKATMIKSDGEKELLTVDNLTDGSVSKVANNAVMVKPDGSEQKLATVNGGVDIHNANPLPKGITNLDDLKGSIYWGKDFAFSRNRNNNITGVPSNMNNDIVVFLSVESLGTADATIQTIKSFDTNLFPVTWTRKYRYLKKEWTKWQEVATNENALFFNTAKNAQVGFGSFNAKRYLQPGAYTWSYADYQGATDNPPFIFNGGTLYTFQDYDSTGSYLMQIFTSYSSSTPVIGYRKRYKGNDEEWSDWQKVATTMTKELTNENLNSFHGEYYWGNNYYARVNNTVTGVPEGLTKGTYFRFEVMQGGGTVTIQKLYTHNTSFMRTYEDATGVWQPWVQVATMEGVLSRYSWEEVSTGDIGDLPIGFARIIWENTCTGLPEWVRSSKDIHYLFTIGDENYRTQIMLADQNGFDCDIGYRHYRIQSKQWSSWKKFNTSGIKLTTENINNMYGEEWWGKTCYVEEGYSFKPIPLPDKSSFCLEIFRIGRETTCQRLTNWQYPDTIYQRTHVASTQRWTHWYRFSGSDTGA